MGQKPGEVRAFVFGCQGTDASMCPSIIGEPAAEFDNDCWPGSKETGSRSRKHLAASNGAATGCLYLFSCFNSQWLRNFLAKCQISETITATSHPTDIEAHDELAEGETSETTL